MVNVLDLTIIILNKNTGPKDYKISTQKFYICFNHIVKRIYALLSSLIIPVY